MQQLEKQQIEKNDLIDFSESTNMTKFLAIYAEKTLVSKLDEFRLNLTSCQAVKLTTDKLGKKQSRLLADKRKLE